MIPHQYSFIIYNHKFPNGRCILSQSILHIMTSSVFSWRMIGSMSFTFDYMQLSPSEHSCHEMLFCICFVGWKTKLFIKLQHNLRPVKIFRIGRINDISKTFKCNPYLRFLMQLNIMYQSWQHFVNQGIVNYKWFSSTQILRQCVTQ